MMNISTAPQRSEDARLQFINRLKNLKSPTNQAFPGEIKLLTYHDFTGSKSHPGYRLEYGWQEASEEGWLFHSTAHGAGPGSSARFYYDFIFNDANHATYIVAYMRGAPDSQKNSNVYLIEPGSGGVQNGSHDEIDIVEVYGTENKAEWCVYKGGYRDKTGPGRYPVSDPGQRAYFYAAYLEKGHYLRIQCLDRDLRVLSTKELSGSSVPDKPLRLYSGIWDMGPNAERHGDTYMSLNSLWLFSAI